jgi:trimeric autotransporter adhesin
MEHLLYHLANTGTAGTYGAENYIPVVTTDVYGRVSAVSNTAVGNLSAAIITSGTLPVARGGTGNTSFTTSGILMGQGTSAITTVESSTEGHVLQINASGVPTFAHLNGGFF